MKKWGGMLFLLILMSCASKKISIEQPPPAIEKNEKKVISLPRPTLGDSVGVEGRQAKMEAAPVPQKEMLSQHAIWDQLLQAYVSPKGVVNYEGLRKEKKKLLQYFEHLQEQMPQGEWSQDQKMAYWINVYNVYTVWLILKHWPLKSIKDIHRPWKQRFFKLGDKWYNLDEVEHTILRKMNDPRIHFAINCASVSCPKLYNRAFSKGNLQSDLNKLTRAFLADTSKNKIGKNHIRLSKIFSWFAKDFKKDGSLVDFLNQYSDIVISKHAKKTYLPYNWSLND
ncbi:MAG: DUF547 domain-containing protein [Flavobacteriaceae bacterium]|nr:DUF547 domain-containing protein [Flavobacteriaceae bacterium]